MMTKLISSQRHINDEIVAEKRETKDFGVSVSPVFELFGEQVQLVMDGHHSWEAARLDGVEPMIAELTVQDSDNIALLLAGNIEGFLLATYIDSDLYDIRTGRDL